MGSLGGCMKLVVCALFTVVAGAAHAADNLPKTMLGAWATDLAACSEQASEIRITVEPRNINFYEHGFEIRRIARQRDGSLKGFGFASDDDGRSRSTIMLKLVAP